MSRVEVLKKLAAGEIDELQADLLLTQVEAQESPLLKMKRGDKGGLSVYFPNGRFPITLYRDQWELLLRDEQVEAIKEAIKKGVLTKAEARDEA